MPERGPQMSGESDGRGRFARGGGRYVGDLATTETLAVGFVRSTLARARLHSVDLTEVRGSSGIVAAFDAKGLLGHVGPLPVRFGPGKTYDWRLLADGYVSFVGEPVALVVGFDRGSVEEACELAAINYEALDAVVDVDVAQTNAELVRPEAGSNVLFSGQRGSGEVDALLASAHVVVERTFKLARQSACPLENRGVLSYEDPLTGELVVCTSTQIPHILRVAISTVLDRREESVRVVVPDVGGGFGLKCQVAAEECLVAWVAHHLGRRVAWLEDRWENLVASNHAHDERVRLRVGFAKDGAIAAVNADITVDVGAHSSYPLSVALEPSSTSAHLFGSYRVPAARINTRGIATNKCPSGAYRGVGGSVANFATERLLDEAARELELSRIEIRRRNLLGAADIPHQHPIGGLIDSGDPRHLFERLLDRLDADDGVREALARSGSRAPAPSDSPLVGVGLAVFAEHSAPGSSIYRGRGVTEVPGYDASRVELREDGTFVVALSSADAGQRHAEICQRQVADLLGVDAGDVSVVEGDTARCPKGTGTFASRFAVAQLSAALRASTRMSEHLVEAAAEYLSCAIDEVKRDGERFESGAGDASVSLKELAHWLYFPDAARTGRTFEVPVIESGYWDGGPTYPNCAVLAVVDVDPETFVAKVRKISALEDCGRVLDEDAVLGQLRGGIVMGIGDAILEEHIYSSDGEILTSSFMDYLLPTVSEAPEFDLALADDPRLFTARSESGAKGVGEAGTIGAVGAVGCALSDAIRDRGGALNSLPGTPLQLFRAFNGDSTTDITEVMS
jgi:aerobic carbon-monoxide dehydrogenase large subunit